MNTVPFANSWPKTRAILIGRALKLEIPPLRDPRYLIWGCQVFFFVLGVESLNFLKSYYTLAACLAAGSLFDLVAVRLFRRQWVLPQSGLVCAAGMALLLESSALWMYAFSVGVALVSKYVFTTGKRHIFNPTAFGLVCMLTFFPNQCVTNPVQWTGSPEVWAIIVALGLVTAWHAKVLDMACGWVGAYFLVALARSAAGLAPLNLSLAIPTGAGFALFVFFMVTDPKTIPIGTPKRIGFALLLAAADGAVRTLGKPNSLYLGLIAAQYLWAIPEVMESLWRLPGARRSRTLPV